jgi:ABC-type glycerol-3-phosphate transport system permease component
MELTRERGEPAAVARRGRQTAWPNALVWGAVLLFLALVFVPILYLLIMSFKSYGQLIDSFWALPRPWLLSNYAHGWEVIAPYLVNTITLVAASTAITVVCSSLASYAFARHRFPGKNVCFFGLLGLMMIPSTLTLVPRYVLVKDLGLLDTPWVLILPWAAQSMAFGVLLCRGFFATLPEELFEAGRIDGAGEWQLYRHVAVPLSFPILVTLAIVNAFEHYNDYLWPLLTISTRAHQVVSVGLTEFDSFDLIEFGPKFAAYVIASVPLAAMFLFGMRYFIRGMTAGALKA